MIAKEALSLVNKLIKKKKKKEKKQATNTEFSYFLALLKAERFLKVESQLWAM